MYNITSQKKAENKMFRSFYYIKKIIFTIFVSTFLLALGAALTSVYTLERYEAITVGSINDTFAGGDATVSVGYCVKEQDGIIGVYDSSNELMYTVEVYVKTLPAKDREILRKGIYADSYGEVLEILGDYTA